MATQIPELEKLSKDYGYFGMFAHRETLDEVNKWAQDLLGRFGEEEIYAMTLVQVMQNTHAILRAKREIALLTRIKELENEVIQLRKVTEE